MEETLPDIPKQVQKGRSFIGLNLHVSVEMPPTHEMAEGEDGVWRASEKE